MADQRSVIVLDHTPRAVDLNEFSRKGALRSLAALAEVHPSPLSASAFVAATGMDAGAAIRLRTDLSNLGLLNVHIESSRGSVRTYSIVLSQSGLKVGRIALALQDAIAALAPAQSQTRKAAQPADKRRERRTRK